MQTVHSSEEGSTGSRRTSNPSSLYCSAISERRKSRIIGEFSGLIGWDENDNKEGLESEFVSVADDADEGLGILISGNYSAIWQN